MSNKRKTIIRYEDNSKQKVVVNTYPEDSDTGIMHMLYMPEEMDLKVCQVGFGWVEKGEELQGTPVIAIIGEGEIEKYAFEAICNCTYRMATVISALHYHTDIDESEYTELDMYKSVVNLIKDYMKSIDAPVFVRFNNPEEVMEGEEYKYAVALRIKNNVMDKFVFPGHTDGLDMSASYEERILVEVPGLIRSKMCGAPDLEDRHSSFFLTVEFNKPIVTMADVFWAFGMILEKGLDDLESIRKEENGDIRLMSSLIYTSLGNMFADLMYIEKGDVTNEEN